MIEHDREYGRYSMIIEWSDEDSAYIVTVPELSGCRTHGRTYEEAIAQGQDAIESWIDAARAGDSYVPPPRTFKYRSSFTADRVNSTQEMPLESRSA
jgi:predicted RNase H-like HicB family nuclease